MHYELYKLLETVTSNTNWNDISNDGKQARSVFTTLCLAFRYEADTATTDEILLDLYDNYIDGNYDINYLVFEAYMLEYII